MDEEILKRALKVMLEEGDVVEDRVTELDLIYLPAMRNAEQIIASVMTALVRKTSNYPSIDVEKALTWLQEKVGRQLAPTQMEALLRALVSRVLIITGGRVWEKRLSCIRFFLCFWQKSEVPALCSHWSSCEAFKREHRSGSQNDSPPS